MGWSIGFDSNWKRDIGYGVPAICDHPACNKEINRGLSYVCGGEAYGGENGCGLFFCSDHLDPELCNRCRQHKAPYDPKSDCKEWRDWKLTDESWQQWRDENPDKVAELKAL